MKTIVVMSIVGAYISISNNNTKVLGQITNCFAGISKRNKIKKVKEKTNL